MSAERSAKSQTATGAERRQALRGAGAAPSARAGVVTSITACGRRRMLQAL